MCKPGHSPFMNFGTDNIMEIHQSPLKSGALLVFTRMPHIVKLSEQSALVFKVLKINLHLKTTEAVLQFVTSFDSVG